ncbi:hypothetical protein B0H16DRAFT_1637415, partial [Mycena metata]
RHKQHTWCVGCAFMTLLYAHTVGSRVSGPTLASGRILSANGPKFHCAARHTSSWGFLKLFYSSSAHLRGGPCTA